MSRIPHKQTILLIAFTLLFMADAMTQGNLLVTPKRVLFEGAARTEILNLSNTGTDSATYQVSFIQVRMRPDGTFENIIQPDSGQQFADKNIRFFPRTVTLGPNEAQTVKLQLIRADQLKTGEYRSHLYLRAVPKEKPRGDSIPTADAGIAVKIVPIFGITIPVIIRVGQTQAQATISDAHIATDEKANQLLQLSFNRTGNQSLYGDVVVNYISAEGKTTPLTATRGIAVYTPNTVRSIKIPLEKKVDYQKGKLHVVYSEQSGRSAKIAETFVNLN